MYIPCRPSFILETARVVLELIRSSWTVFSSICALFFTIHVKSFLPLFGFHLMKMRSLVKQNYSRPTYHTGMSISGRPSLSSSFASWASPVSGGGCRSEEEKDEKNVNAVLKKKTSFFPLHEEGWWAKLCAVQGVCEIKQVFRTFDSTNWLNESSKDCSFTEGDKPGTLGFSLAS